MKELQQQIIEWAKAKGIDNTQNQRLKVLEEVGETAGAILKGNRDEILMEIGDVIVTTIILRWLLGEHIELNPEPHLHEGYEEQMVDDLVRIPFMADMSDDTLGYLIYITAYFGSTLKECLTMAWNKIKDRQGKTVNGTFIKNE